MMAFAVALAASAAVITSSASAGVSILCVPFRAFMPVRFDRLGHHTPVAAAACIAVGTCCHFLDSTCSALRDLDRVCPTCMHGRLYCWGGSVRGLFDAAGIVIDVTETTHAGHAHDMAMNEDFTVTDGIVVVGRSC